MATFDEDRFKSLTVGFSGARLRPGEDGYEEARRVHNGRSTSGRGVEAPTGTSP